MTQQLLEIPVDLIDRDPAQPRTRFDEVALAELADSIRAHGVLLLMAGIVGVQIARRVGAGRGQP